MTRRQKTVLGLMGSAAAMASALAITATSATPPAKLPDLVSQPPANPYFGYWDEIAEEPRLLLRFDGFVANDGAGPLDVQGDPRTGKLTQYLWKGSTFEERVLAAAGRPDIWEPVTTDLHPRSPDVVYDPGDGHEHWHVQRIAEYSLWDATKTAQVVPGSKVGFCLYDYEQDRAPKGPSGAIYSDPLTGGFCEQYNPDATSLREGVSEGWRDVYEGYLAYQWIDVSDVLPGVYHLANRADPEDVVLESDEENELAFSDAIVVPGYRATAPAPVATPEETAITVPLTSTAFGAQPNMNRDLGPVRYRVVTTPDGGLLRRDGAPVYDGQLLPIGTSSLTYVPYGGFSGPDSFTFAAIDSAVPDFPSQPAQATASIVVGAPTATVSMSDVPGQMVAGSQAQLGATASDGGAIAWTATAGSVSATGVFTAPAQVPPGGTVTVRAALADDPDEFREATITIVPAPAPQPEPRPTAPPPTVPPAQTATPPSTGGNTTGTPMEALSRPGVLAAGRRITATVDVNAPGRTVIEVTLGAKRLRACAQNTPAGRSVTCRFVLPRAYPPGTLVVRALLREGDGSVHRTATRVGATSSGAPLACGLPKRPVTLSLPATAAQLRINQRISVAALRRLAAINARLDGKPAPPPSAKRPAPIRPSTVQLRINQRISEAGYRRARALYVRLGGQGAAAPTSRAGSLVFNRPGVGVNQLTNIRTLDLLNCINRTP